VQDGTDEQGMAGLGPVVAAIVGAFRVDQDVGDVLRIADLIVALADFE
jgi:hypothetical protein